MIRAEIEQIINQGHTTEMVVLIAVISATTVLIADRIWNNAVNKFFDWRKKKKDSYASMYSRHRKGDQA